MTGQLSNSVARKVNGEVVVVLGWGRAILMQIAHPLVAAGVAQHSNFGEGSLGYLRRSHRTISAMLELTFGSDAVVKARAVAINEIHQRVHGHLREPTTGFPVGTSYSATDPALLEWVHATLVESQLMSYQLFVGELSLSDRDAYCAEAAQVGPLLGLPPGRLPETEGDLRRYIDGMLVGGAVQVTQTARNLAGNLLYPPGMLSAALGPGRLVSVGLLPGSLRDSYQYSWGAPQDRRLQRLAWAVRAARPLLPRLLRRWPPARTRRV